MNRGVLLTALLAAGALCAQAPRLEIRILEGNDVINYFNQRTAQEPIVQIEDENHRPVSGAAVLFRLPDSGPSGVFRDGSRRLLVISDDHGRAVARGLVANHEPGQFQITVTATHGPESGQAILRQTNRKPLITTETAHHGLFTTKAWIIVGVVVGAAAAGGIAVAGGGGGGHNPPPNIPAPAGATIATPGVTIVGPPR